MTKEQAKWESCRDAVPEGVEQYTVYDEASGQRVATVFSKANAHLFAAAPDLLAACNRMVFELQAMHSHHYPGECDCPTNEALRIARAAIARAEGGAA